MGNFPTCDVYFAHTLISAKFSVGFIITYSFDACLDARGEKYLMMCLTMNVSSSKMQSLFEITSIYSYTKLASYSKIFSIIASDYWHFR